MSNWTNQATATLKMRQAHSSESISLVGVNPSNSAGTPENFLDAANHILDIAGLSAVKTGMTRTVVQEVSE